MIPEKGKGGIWDFAPLRIVVIHAFSYFLYNTTDLTYRVSTCVFFRLHRSDLAGALRHHVIGGGLPVVFWVL